MAGMPTLELTSRRLVSRRHVDLLRVASASCPGPAAVRAPRAAGPAARPDDARSPDEPVDPRPDLLPVAA